MDPVRGSDISGGLIRSGGGGGGGWKGRGCSKEKLMGRIFVDEDTLQFLDSSK